MFLFYHEGHEAHEKVTSGDPVHEGVDRDFKNWRGPINIEVIGPGGDVVHRSWDTIEGLAHSYGVDDSMNHRYEFVPEESGHHSLRVKVDCDNDVREYNEDNNEYNSRGFRIYGESTDSDDRVP